MEVDKQEKIILKLSKEEAAWLKLLVQNPVGGVESDKDRKIREAFWNALSGKPCPHCDDPDCHWLLHG